MIGSVEGTGVVSADASLGGRLRDGDERAFDEVVSSFSPAMLAVARGFVGARSVAEEVVQEAWLGVLRGLDRFEGRSTLRTWVLRIVANIARDRAVREARSLPFSPSDFEGNDPAVDVRRFRLQTEPYPGGWRSFPSDWRLLPETQVTGRETLAAVREAIAALPDAQRMVVTLRDVLGCPAEEVCEALDLTPGNQRVLLHRARARVRAHLERHFDG